MTIETSLRRSFFKRGIQINNIMYGLFYFSVLTISFDIFLVIPLGFNFRISQLALIPVFFYTALSSLHRPIKIPMGYKYLLAWSFFVIAFIPNTSFLLRSIGYGFWHIFNITLLLIPINLFTCEEDITRLIKLYIFTFVIISIFGLMQFILPLLHLGGPLVMQWWFPGVLARINGFSYEPSYFSTYMLIGWVLVAYLIKEKSTLLKRKYLLSTFVLLSAVIILSTSRMGIIMMLLWYLQYPILFVKRLIMCKLNLRYLKACILLVIIISTVCTIVIYVIGFDKISFLLAGLDIAGDSSHSSGPRLEGLTATLNVFMNSPIIGSSLGGVASKIGELNGISVDTLEGAKAAEGMNIFAEVLAASGIIGFIPFLLYVVSIVFKPLKLATQVVDREIRTILIGMTYSLVFLLAILQMNQNILRPYIWLHISILCSVFSVAKMSSLEKNGSRA